MNSKLLAEINRSRLENWRGGLNDANCTAFLLLGVGHDDVAGELHLWTLDFADTDLDIVPMLEKLLALMREKKVETIEETTRGKERRR